MRVVHLARNSQVELGKPAASTPSGPSLPVGAVPPARWPSTSAARGSGRSSSSPARRTRETLEFVAEALPTSRTVEQELYGADEEDLLLRLRKLPATVTAVLLIGHNPALQGLAVALGAGGEPEALARLRAKMPTGALAGRQCNAGGTSAPVVPSGS